VNVHRCIVCVCDCVHICLLTSMSKCGMLHDACAAIGSICKMGMCTRVALCTSIQYVPV
jgi:hypothetical protein